VDPISVRSGKRRYGLKSIGEVVVNLAAVVFEERF
jgi:hypothetical protein